MPELFAAWLSRRDHEALQFADLSDFLGKIDTLFDLDATAHKVSRPTGVAEEAAELDDEVVMFEPIMRQLMNAARPDLGDYERGTGDEYHHRYRWQEAKRAALQAKGIHLFGAEAKRRLQPEAPELVADQFHEWVWTAARPAWEIGSYQDAVQAAARLVNAALQKKLGRYDQADLALCREAFSTDQPAPGKPRLRFPGDRTSETWRSRQVGGANFGRRMLRRHPQPRGPRAPAQPPRELLRLSRRRSRISWSRRSSSADSPRSG